MGRIGGYLVALLSKGYSYAYITSLIRRIMGKHDFRELLEYTDIEDALKFLSTKHLGIKFQEILASKTFSLRIIDDSLNESLRLEYNKLYSLIPRREKEKVDLVEELVDAYNLSVILSSISTGSRPTLLLPAGSIFRTGINIEEIDGVDKLYSILGERGLGKYIELVRKARGEPLNILYRATKPLRHKIEFNTVFKRVYGILHDILWIKAVYKRGEIPRKLIPSLYTITSSVLTATASASSLLDLANILRQTYLSGFSEILVKLTHLGSPPGSLLLSLALYVSSNTSDLLLQERGLPYVRCYILLYAENIITRVSLASISSNMFREELKEMILGWWPL